MRILIKSHFDKIGKKQVTRLKVKVIDKIPFSCKSCNFPHFNEEGLGLGLGLGSIIIFCKLEVKQGGKEERKHAWCKKIFLLSPNINS